MIQSHEHVTCLQFTFSVFNTHKDTQTQTHTRQGHGLTNHNSAIRKMDDHPIKGHGQSDKLD